MALECPLLMHAPQNFDYLSAQGHRQGLGAEAKTKAMDLHVETKARAKTFKNVVRDTQGFHYCTVYMRPINRQYLRGF